MRKIGILGGTFNPIHNGHITLANEAKRQFGLEEVWMMPSKLPPHKSHFSIRTEEERLQMVSLAVQGQEGLVASDFECKREGLTYTADTLELLHNQYPDLMFYFIIGGDSLVDFLTWKDPSRILKYATILASSRYGIQNEKQEQALSDIMKKFPNARVFRFTIPECTESSSRIRASFYEGKSSDVRKDMPISVYDYLCAHNFYSKVSYEELDICMRELLPTRRYYHSVGVAQLCAAYAARYNYSVEKAMIAGILHDCAKTLPDNQLVEEAAARNISCSEVAVNNGFLLHGAVGAAYAKEKYYIYDSDILSAIFWHTTGKPEMTLLEKIVFLADFLEPFRTQKSTPPLEVIRNVVFDDIDYAMELVLNSTIEYLKTTGRDIEPLSLEALEYYRRKSQHE